MNYKYLEIAEEVYQYAGSLWNENESIEKIGAALLRIHKETIEQCAKIADKYANDPFTSDSGIECQNVAQEIRSLLK